MASKAATKKPSALKKPPASKFPLRLEYLKASDLVDHPLNWQDHTEQQAACLKDAIGEVGNVDPILKNDNTGYILDGHLRKRVEGDNVVPVVIGWWSVKDEKKVLLYLDTIRKMGLVNNVRASHLLDEVETSSSYIQGMLNDMKESIATSLDTDKGKGAGGGSGPRVIECPACGHEFDPKAKG